MSINFNSANAVGQISTELHKKNGLAVKVKSEKGGESSEVVHNPFGQDKIEISQSSLKEELALIKSQEQQKNTSREALDDLQGRLLQMRSVLHQVAATISFDADSLETIEKQLQAEMNDSAEILKKVDLPGLKSVNLESFGLQEEEMQLNSQEDVTRVGGLLESAAQEVEKLKSQAEISESEKRTGKTLEIAGQNTEAALSTYNPRDIFTRADSVAQSLREQGATAFQAHNPVDYKSVINLIG